MKIMGKAVAAGMLICSLASLVSAAGTSSAQFLKLGAGARAAALGQSFTGIADDVTATYWNPAGLSQIQTPQLSLMQNAWLMDSQYQFAGFGMPTAHGAWGVSVQRVDFGSIDQYTAADVKDGSFEANSLAGGLTLSGKISDRYHWGLTGKFIQESIEEEKASTFAGDFGILFNQDIFTFGLAVQNMGPGLKFVEESYPLPQTIRLGASSKLFEEKVIAVIEASKPNDDDPSIHGGLEFKVLPAFQIRGGYHVTPGNQLDVDGLTNLSGGFGLSLGKMTLDYAFLPFGDLGSAHQVSLLLKFR